jgi:hypothetical protein
VTCAGKSSDIFEIYVSTWVDTDSHSIHPRSSAPHQVELTNLSPVSTEVQLHAECVGGSPLSYGGKPWEQTIPLSPARHLRRAGPAKFREGITHDGTAPPQGGSQRIRVRVTTVPPSVKRQIYPLSETYADISIYVRC